MTETAAYLQSWFQRVERNREERKGLTAFERDLFAEAKGRGLDSKALRKVLQRRDMGDAACSEMDALIDAYEAALGSKKVAADLIAQGASVRSAAKAAGVGYGTARRAKNKISGSPEHDPATGEITPSPPARAPSVTEAATDKAAVSPSAGGGPSPAGKWLNNPADCSHDWTRRPEGHLRCRLCGTRDYRDFKPSPAGSPLPPADSSPVASSSPDSDDVPAGEPDACEHDWRIASATDDECRGCGEIRRHVPTAGENVAPVPGDGSGACNLAAPVDPAPPSDGEASFILGMKMLGGKEPVGEVDTAMTKAVIDDLRAPTFLIRGTAENDAARGGR